MSNSIFQISSVKLLKRAFAQTYILPRFYRKNFLRRIPIAVHNVSTENDLIPPIREKDFSPQKSVIASSDALRSLSIPDEKREEILIPPYEKIQKNDARFTKILTVMKNRKMRERSGKILIEGKRLINDALQAGVKLQALYFSREKDLAEIKLRTLENVEICKVLYKTLKVWSALTTCPGVMGVFKRPTLEELNVLSEPSIPVTVVCDNIRDPGNLGSIIRNSAAAGCERLLLMKGCVDPWEIKVLRAGCGGQFRIPIIYDLEWTHINNYLSKESTIFVADNAADIDEQSYSSDFINFDESAESEEETKYITINEQKSPIQVDETYTIRSELEKYQELHVPCHLYSSMKFPKKDIVLYVGGETHGIDSRVTKLICDYGGNKIKIPLENGMESLNSSFAMTIVLYEIKRQIKEIYVTKE
ncbi:rRNA methyltransferase 3, mitochondrial-like [Uloborus diversus]|uniref:rRNA methyltransferase 3, mitochondrial-like n=1 Tax=Uloborus diversus TaxID=327109 RepID=UPI00240A6AC2|nr:rRNA methyltransferase 3, mitochondrial-like [Uloborus diversus]